MPMRRGAYPGTFNPPTVAHLAVAEAARAQCRLDRIDFVLSVAPLGKVDDPGVPAVERRVRSVERVLDPFGWANVVWTEAQLIADIADGYDVVIVGADKWSQVVDPSWYIDAASRDEALARLSHVAVAPRPPHGLPPPGPRITILDIDPVHHSVSSSAVRSGEHRWLAPGAAPEDRPT